MHTFTPTTYKHVAKGCVGGHNIILHKSKTVGQCEALCEAEPRCKAFEYGVAHGGSNTGYKPSDCQLQDSANTAGCSGAHYNLDLYIKPHTPTYSLTQPGATTCPHGTNPVTSKQECDRAAKTLATSKGQTQGRMI